MDRFVPEVLNLVVELLPVVVVQLVALDGELIGQGERAIGRGTVMGVKGCNVYRRLFKLSEIIMAIKFIYLLTSLPIL
jgi:hypothetical protein